MQVPFSALVDTVSVMMAEDVAVPGDLRPWLSMLVAVRAATQRNVLKARGSTEKEGEREV